MNNQPKRIAFYLRSATGNLADLKRQLKAVQNECAAKGFESQTMELYQDTHQSGLRPGPEFDRMIQDIVAGRIGVVMVSRMNRISRSLKELMKFQDFVGTNQIRLICVHENVDSIHWLPKQSNERGAQ